MDQLKTGKFIAECRKEKKLTQAQLAEKLCITDKAISKWERGIAMPDSAIMLELCGILDINVNELLSGERIDVSESNKKTEELLIEMTKKDQRNRKKLFKRTFILLVLYSLMLFISAALYLLSDFEYFLATTILFWVSWTIYMIAVVIFVTMEVDSGIFVCRSCNHEFVPKYKEAFFTIGYGTPKRWNARLKCPKCGKKTWARRIF